MRGPFVEGSCMSTWGVQYGKRRGQIGIRGSTFAGNGMAGASWALAY